MTQLEQQMKEELEVAQGFTNNLAANLSTKGVAASNTEGLDTLVPKVLQIAKPPYEEWQDGFGVNWDNVVANAPMTNVYRILHVYTKVELLRMHYNFPTGTEIYTYNGSVYRQITMDANKQLAFINDDYITNTSDNLQYVCVLFGGTNLSNDQFFQNLPIVYSNSKSYRQTTYDDKYVNILFTNYIYVPLIRGIDCYRIEVVNIHPTLEHLTYQVANNQVDIQSLHGADTQVRLLKNIIDTLPQNTSIIFSNFQRYNIQISDEKLADLLYNDWIYNNSNVTMYMFPKTNNVKTFKLNPNYQLKTSGNNYLNGLPNAMYLTGTVTEDQTSTATDGRHGFNYSAWTILQNFPMWTVLEGATTGCLLPMVSQTSVGLYGHGSFIFYSPNLEARYFCEFDENGIIEDPTKYFLCNLPVQNISHVNIYVRFTYLRFKDNYTASQQDAIRTYLANKNWNLVW